MTSQSARERECHAPNTEKIDHILSWGHLSHAIMQWGLYREENLVLQYFQGCLTSSKPENKDSTAIRVRKEGRIEVASALRLVPPTSAA